MDERPLKWIKCTQLLRTLLYYLIGITSQYRILTYAIISDYNETWKPDSSFPHKNYRINPTVPLNCLIVLFTNSIVIQ